MDSSTVQYLWDRYKMADRDFKRWLLNTTKQKCETIDDLTDAQLLRLADLVLETASYKGRPPSGVADIIKILGSEIADRKECAQWHRFHRVESPARLKADEEHQYYIGVLISVMRKLKEAKRGGAQMDGVGAGAVAPPTEKTFNYDVLHRLEELDVAAEENEMPDEGPPKSPSCGASEPSRRQASVSSATTWSSNSIKDSLEDRHALDTIERDRAIWCFFKEIELIRPEVRSTWTKFSKGEAELDSAFLVTTHAVALLVGAVNSLKEEFPEFESFESIAEHLRLTAREEHDDLAQIDEPGAQNADTEDDTCSRAWTALLICQEILDLQGSDFTSLDSEMKDLLKRLHPSIQSLLHLAPEFKALADEWANGIMTVSKDAFTEAFASFVHSKGQIGTSLVGLLQIHLDIVEILGQPEQAFKSLVSKAVGLKDSVTRNEAFFGQKSATGKVEKSSLNEVLGATVLEGLGVAFEDVNADLPIEKCNAMTRCLPVLAGMYAWELTQKTHRYGVALCNQEGLVVAAAHLYQACRQKSAMKQAWPEMDKLILLQGPQTLGLADTTESMPSMETRGKQYGLAMGVELVQFAKSRNGKQSPQQKVPLPPGPKSSRKPLRLGSTIMSKLTVKDNALHRLRIEQTKGSIIILHQVAEDVIKHKPELVDKAVIKKWNEEHTLTSNQLLSILAASLEAEETALDFDYLHLVESCFKLASKLERRPFTGSSGFQDIVNDVLWSAAERERQVISGKGRITAVDWLGTASRTLAACVGILEDTRMD